MRKNTNHLDYTHARTSRRIGTIFISVVIVFVGIILVLLPFLPNAEKSPIFGVLSNLGIAMIPAGVVAVAYEFLLRDSFVEEMRQQLSISLANQFEYFSRVEEAGIINIHDMFPTTDVASRFSSAKSIFIVQTWIPDIIPLLRSIENAINNGASIRILLMDPDSELAKVRSIELGYSSFDVASNNINTNIEELRRFSSRLSVQNKLEVRMYDATPVACYHQYDDTAFVGFYWRNTPAIQGPQIEFKVGNSSFCNVVLSHVGDLWENSNTMELKHSIISKENINDVKNGLNTKTYSETTEKEEQPA